MKALTTASDNIGFKEKMRQRISVTQSVAIITAFVGACYTVFSYIFYRELVLYPIACFVFSISAIFLNKNGWNNTARLMLSFLVMGLAFIYHAFLVQKNEPIIFSLYIIQMSLTVIPWVLFDYDESRYLISTLIVCYVLFFSQDACNQLIEKPLDSSLFREGILNTISYVFAVIILVSCLLFLKLKYHNAETRKNKLVSALEDQAQELTLKQKELEGTMQEVNENRAKDEIRSWSASGLAELNDLLHRHDDKSSVFDVVLSYLVNYMQGNQGGIYLVEEDKLTLKSCYAYSRKKYKTAHISINDGILGQSVKEKSYIYISDVPDDYVDITSGLGNARPKNILVVPFVRNRVVEGVIELASFNLFETYQIEFLKKVGENLAAFIYAYKNAERTEKLLKESEKYAEKMYAQEEEMRQNMEELSTIQEALIRKEEAYKVKIEMMQKKIMKLSVNQTIQDQ